MKGICGRDCGRCILYDYCGGCSLCEASICSKDCGRCYTMCLERPETVAYINFIGGPKIEVKENPEIKMPVHIPILPDRFRNTPEYELMPFIGVHGGNAFARNGERVNKSYIERGYQGALNVDKRTKGILEFYIKDRTLEGFWDKRQSIYPVLRDMNFAAVIAPNFSVYEDAPRIDHLYNIRRSTVVYNEMLDKGIPAIPDVAWFSKKDLDHWCGEINKNDVKTISFSFQVVDVGLKTSNVWRTSLLGFRYLCQNIKSDIDIIVAGIVSPFRTIEVFKASCGQRIHILNQSSYVQSRRGILSATRRQERDISFDELFEKNVRYFNKLYEKMSQDFRNKENDNMFSRILTWENCKLKEFYIEYIGNHPGLGEKYGISEENLDIAFSVVRRQMNKKKVKVESIEARG